MWTINTCPLPVLNPRLFAPELCFSRVADAERREKSPAYGGGVVPSAACVPVDSATSSIDNLNSWDWDESFYCTSTCFWIWLSLARPASRCSARWCAVIWHCGASRDITLAYIYISIYLSIYLSIYIYICACVCVCHESCMSRMCPKVCATLSRV